jgi:hypothetical protein
MMIKSRANPIIFLGFLGGQNQIVLACLKSSLKEITIITFELSFIICWCFFLLLLTINESNMGRELKYRVLLKGVLPPSENSGRNVCKNCWYGGRCDECQEAEQTYSQHVSGWHEIDGISRGNDVLGYCFSQIYSQAELVQRLRELAEEMSKASDALLIDFAEVIGAFGNISYRVDMFYRGNETIKVEIKYD